ncbi:MAG: HD domain-containing protein [Anaerovoracaceae bacterium]
MNRLSREECFQLLKDYGTPEHVIAHCRAVAKVATTLGMKLKEKGVNLDLNLIESSALLHDIARVEPEHEKVAAAFLEKKGYPEQARIIALHMHYSAFHEVFQIDETDLVCLGDRVCKEDRYVGVEERMAYILNKAKDNPKAVEIIKIKKRELQEFVSKIEAFLGCSLDQLMKG